MKQINKKQAKKIAFSFYDDLNKDLKDKKFRKIYNQELLKLRIADEVHKLRRNKKLSQKKLAREINTTQAVISRIENAQVCASTNLLQRICNAFGVSAKFKFCNI